MTCQNCCGGTVRKFEGKKGKAPARFYDETCPVCKGEWYKPEPIPEPDREIIQPKIFEQIECPF